MAFLGHMEEFVFYFNCEVLKWKNLMIWFTFQKDQLKCHVGNSIGFQEQKAWRTEKSYYSNQGKEGQGHTETFGIFTRECQQSKDVSSPHLLGYCALL